MRQILRNAMELDWWIAVILVGAWWIVCAWVATAVGDWLERRADRRDGLK